MTVNGLVIELFNWQGAAYVGVKPVLGSNWAGIMLEAPFSDVEVKMRFFQDYYVGKSMQVDTDMSSGYRLLGARADEHNGNWTVDVELEDSTGVFKTFRIVKTGYDEYDFHDLGEDLICEATWV